MAQIQTPPIYPGYGCNNIYTNDCQNEDAVDNDTRRQLFSNNNQSVPHSAAYMNTENYRHGLQVDMIDGDDEPAGGYSSELENFAQPHVLLMRARYERFSNEEVRKRTFASWKNPFPDVTALIASGFFFLGGTDSVQCFHCGIILHSWEQNDIPDQEHLKHSRDCVYMQQKAQRSQTASLPSSVEVRPCTQNPPVPTRQQQQHEENIKKLANSLGHSMQNIERAFTKLKLGGERTVDTDMLLDAVFDIESDGDGATVEDGDKGATGGHSETMPVLNLEAEVKESYHSDQKAKSNDAQTDPDVVHHGNREMPAEVSESDDKEIHEIADKLKKENDELKKQTTCLVCWENPATELFLPCVHLVCCKACSVQLRICPYCRKKITSTVHVYRP